MKKGRLLASVIALVLTLALCASCAPAPAPLLPRDEGWARTMEYYQTVQEEMRSKVSGGGRFSFAVTQGGTFMWENGLKKEPERFDEASLGAPIKHIDESGIIVLLLETGEIRIFGNDLMLEYEQTVENAKMVARNTSSAFVLLEDGTVKCLYNKSGISYSRCKKWRDIVFIACDGFESVIGLRADGTVVQDGRASARFNASQWKDLVQIAMGWTGVMGLRKDGTVLAVGDYLGYGSSDEPPPPKADYDVSGWRDIVQVVAGTNNYVGLKADGTVCMDGWELFVSSLSSALAWEDIIYISGGGTTLVGVQSDGTVLCTDRPGLKLPPVEVRTPKP